MFGLIGRVKSGLLSATIREINLRPKATEITALFLPSNGVWFLRVKFERKWDLRQRKFAVGLCAMATLFEGINNALAAPFFPDKANEKG